MRMGRIGRRRLLAGASGVGVLWLAACTEDKPREEAQTGTPGGTPVASGTGQAGTATAGGSGGARRGGTMRLAGGPLGGDLDPHTAITPVEASGIWDWAGNQLLRFGPFMLPEPDLAASQPELADEGATQIYRLRREARWQQRAPVNGRAIEAEDVVQTIARVRDPFAASPRAGLFANVAAVEAPDAATVVIKMLAPEADFTSMLAGPYQVIVPKEWTGAVLPVAQATGLVGTGPYQLESYSLNEGFRLTRRGDGYWKPDTAWLDGLQYTRVDEPSAVLNALKAGQVDAAPVSGAELAAVQADARFQVLQRRDPTRECLLLNQAREPYRDVRVRQAIWRAIDRKAVYETLFGGLGVPGGAMTPAALPWALPEQELATLPGFLPDRDADLTEARRLLAAAGYPNGFEGSILAAGAFLSDQAAALYVEQVARIGVRWTVENTGAEVGAFLERQFSGDYAAAAGVFVDEPFPDAQLTRYHYSDTVRNYAGYSNERLDALLGQQSRELDLKRRQELVYDIQRSLINEPSGFIWVGSRIIATAFVTGLRGFELPNLAAGYPLAEQAYFATGGGQPGRR